MCEEHLGSCDGLDASPEVLRRRAGSEKQSCKMRPDTRGVEAGMLDVAQMVERASDVAALTEAVMELGWRIRRWSRRGSADSRGRALPLRLRERLREMVDLKIAKGARRERR